MNNTVKSSVDVTHFRSVPTQTNFVVLKVTRADEYFNPSLKPSCKQFSNSLHGSIYTKKGEHVLTASGGNIPVSFDYAKLVKDYSRTHQFLYYAQQKMTEGVELPFSIALSLYRYASAAHL